LYIVITILIVYALGIISYEYDFYFISFLLIFIALFFNSLKSKKIIYNLVLVIFLILSFANCYYNSKSVVIQYINEDIEIIAEIKSQNKTANFDSKYNSFNSSLLYINGKKLNLKENTIIYIDKNVDIGLNTVIKLSGNVADTSFSKNTMLFDYKKYLRGRKVYATIFAQNEITVIKENYSVFIDISNNFRRYTEKLFYDNISKESADIILSIILGDVDYLNIDLYDNIKTMGLAHIFAVSGSHIVLLYGVLLRVLKFVVPNRRISWLLTWALIWFYGFLIGFPLSVLRTLVMFTLLFGSEVMYRKYSSLNSIALAGLILTIANPFWIFDAGFLLSFSAALSLIIYNKYILKYIKTENLILRDFYLFLFLQIFTLPILAHYFNYIPIMGILYNLLLIPIFTFILIYSFALLIFGGLIVNLFIFPFRIFDYMLVSLRYLINFTENFAFNGIIIHTFSIFHNIIFYLVLTFIIYLYNEVNLEKNKDRQVKLNRKIYMIMESIFIWIIISFYFITYILTPKFDDSLYLNIMDAGQGMFINVSYKNYNLIFDCGSTSNSNLGSYTVVPYLIKNGIDKVDGVFISHWDEDHYSGLTELIKSNIDVKRIFSSNDFTDDNLLNDNMSKKKNIENVINLKEILSSNIIVLKKDDNVKINENFNIEILWPEDEYSAENKNNSSLVIMLYYKGRKILIPADIESDVENIIYGDLFKSDILIVPHHGSKTSSTDNFVEAVSPNISVFSYGKNNYGIPSDEVIEKYENINSNILTTFDQGQIKFILKDEKLYYNTYKGEKSYNYYELFFDWIIIKILVFGFFIGLIFI